MKCKEKRGINMSDFILFDKAIKVSWVKVLYCDEESPLKMMHE